MRGAPRLVTYHYHFSKPNWSCSTSWFLPSVGSSDKPIPECFKGCNRFGSWLGLSHCTEKICMALMCTDRKIVSMHTRISQYAMVNSWIMYNYTVYICILLYTHISGMIIQQRPMRMSKNPPIHDAGTTIAARPTSGWPSPDWLRTWWVCLREKSSGYPLAFKNRDWMGFSGIYLRIMVVIIMNIYIEREGYIYIYHYWEFMMGLYKPNTTWLENSPSMECHLKIIEVTNLMDRNPTMVDIQATLG